MGGEDSPTYDYHERESIETRPCPQCGAQLVFDIARQMLGCPSCGYGQEITNDPGAVVQEQSLHGAMVQAFASRQAPQLQEEKEVVCQNCGGHTTFVGTNTMVRCPYCATPIERTDVHDAPNRLAVDGVLPFTVTDKTAEERLKEWIQKRWFAPNEFKRYSRTGSFESVYAAYFTYDAVTTTDYRGERGETRTRTVRRNGEEHTETYTQWYSASGRVVDSFDDVMVLGNIGFDRRYVDKLEPWPTHQLQPYNPEYVAGHLCRTYDRGVDECFEDAKVIMEHTIDRSIRRDIGGDQQRIHHKSIHWANQTYKHVLLPIWLLTVIYEEKPLQVFMNGVTGEIHGQRPWSKVKIAAAVIAVIIVIAIALVVRSALQ
jgi:DNA-directed RNA polymerase subunit M/transcription elongation factor TFIIS